MVETWEERGIQGYAEDWFARNGFEWTLKRRYRSKTQYAISRDGFTDDVEIPDCVTMPVAFMEQVEKTFELGRKLARR